MFSARKTKGAPPPRQQSVRVEGHEEGDVREEPVERARVLRAEFDARCEAHVSRAVAVRVPIST